MKNGLNVGAISEIVHEILMNPAEAIVRYDASASLIADGEMDVRIMTIRAGTVRIGRRFALRSSSRPKGRSMSFGEILAAGMSGCVLITFVQGSSARGVTLNSVRVELTVLPEPDPDGCLLRYRWIPDCDARAEQLLEICHQVACFSPNHRTAIEPNSITAKILSDVEDPGSVLRAERVDSVAESARHADRPVATTLLDWQYGTQGAGSTFCEATSSSTRFEVDQAKQYSGLDKGLNPQEFLLSALSSEVRGLLGPAHAELPVRAQGKVDIRGLLNVVRGAEVRVHDIDVFVQAVPGVDPDEQLAELVAALRESSVARLICVPQRIRVEIQRADGGVDQFFSDLKTRDLMIGKFVPKTG